MFFQQSGDQFPAELVQADIEIGQNQDLHFILPAGTPT